MKQTQSPADFLPLKPHWFHVLLSLADQEQHGYGIMQEVLERTDGKVRLWPATLYGTLKRLIGRGSHRGIRRPPRRRNQTTRAAATTGSPGSAAACWPPKATGWRTWSA